MKLTSLNFEGFVTIAKCGIEYKGGVLLMKIVLSHREDEISFVHNYGYYAFIRDMHSVDYQNIDEVILRINNDYSPLEFIFFLLTKLTNLTRLIFEFEVWQCLANDILYDRAVNYIPQCNKLSHIGFHSVTFCWDTYKSAIKNWTKFFSSCTTITSLSIRPVLTATSSKYYTHLPGMLKRLTHLKSLSLSGIYYNTLSFKFLKNYSNLTKLNLKYGYYSSKQVKYLAEVIPECLRLQDVHIDFSLRSWENESLKYYEKPLKKLTLSLGNSKSLVSYQVIISANSKYNKTHQKYTIFLEMFKSLMSSFIATNAVITYDETSYKGFSVRLFKCARKDSKIRSSINQKLNIFSSSNDLDREPKNILEFNYLIVSVLQQLYLASVVSMVRKDFFIYLKRFNNPYYGYCKELSFWHNEIRYDIKHHDRESFSTFIQMLSDKEINFLTDHTKQLLEKHDIFALPQKSTMCMSI